MSLWEAVAVLAAGMAAGGINAVVGSGTLVTFPVLLALGYPPVVANVSNNIGLVPGSIAGAYGYRRELQGSLGRVLRFCSASLIGALIGASLLLVLPASAFRMIIPVLIAIALILIIFQPRLNTWVQKRRKVEHAHGGPVLWGAILATGVYGGYFGAAQGILMMSLLAIFLADDMQTLNGVKNVLAGTANAAAAVLFIIVAEVDWKVVGLIAVGSTLGGLAGASVGRKLSPVVLRSVIVCVGLVGIAKVISG